MDEYTLSWHANHPLMGTIERKPEKEHIKLFVQTFFLTKSGHPVVYFILPDIHIPFLTDRQVMDNVAISTLTEQQ